MENIASKVLQSPKYNGDTKALAASVLSQSNKERYEERIYEHKYRI